VGTRGGGVLPDGSTPVRYSNREAGAGGRVDACGVGVGRGVLVLGVFGAGGLPRSNPTWSCPRCTGPVEVRELRLADGTKWRAAGGGGKEQIW